MYIFYKVPLNSFFFLSIRSKRNSFHESTLPSFSYYKWNESVFYLVCRKGIRHHTLYVTVPTFHSCVVSSAKSTYVYLFDYKESNTTSYTFLLAFAKNNRSLYKSFKESIKKIPEKYLFSDDHWYTLINGNMKRLRRTKNKIHRAVTS